MSAPTSIDYLKRLVAFPTVSRDSNLDLIAFLRRELEEMGARSELVESEDGCKANLFATLGASNQPGIVLSGHTDVVPVDGQAWSSDPFAVRVADGKLFGRGTADMKAFIACTLSMFRNAARLRLSTPLHLAFSYDEEVGCIGVRRLIAMLQTLPVRPRFCIVGEPTSLQVVTAHKGKIGRHVECRGLEAHSSLAPLAVNAIHLALDLISEIRAIQNEIALSGLRDGDYEIPYTTLHAGNIAGGEVINIVPNRCSFDFEIRFLPLDAPQKLVQRIEAQAKRIVRKARDIHPGADIVFTSTPGYPAMNTRPDSEVVSFVKSLTGGNSTGKISFGTEGGLYQEELDIPTVVCGPGNIAVAHKPDEYIEASQIAACDEFLARLLTHVTA